MTFLYDINKLTYSKSGVNISKADHFVKSYVR